MADINILEMPVAIAVDGSEYLPLVQGGTTKRATVNQVGTVGTTQAGLDAITTAQGAVIFRGASVWEGLGPSTTGYVLSTQGPAADPQWVPNTAGSVTSVDVSGGTTGLTTTGGPVTSAGTITIQGTLIAANGGTGFSSYTIGDLLYADSSTSLATLASVATGNALISGGIGTAPSWGKIALGTAVSGVLPAANGGTGVASLGTLTRVDDTNVTLTLGGTPANALIQSVSMTLGWSGTLAVTRGGTGLGTLAQGDLLYGSASNTLSALAKDTNATRYLSNTGTSNNPAWAQVDLSNGVTGSLVNPSITGNLTINGGSGLTEALTINKALTGSPGPGVQAPANTIHVVSDDTTMDSGNMVANALLITHNFGGPAMWGARETLRIISQMTDDGDPLNLNPQYVNATFEMLATVSDNNAGGFFSINPRTLLAPSLGILAEATGSEVDITVATGSFPNTKSGYSVFCMAEDAEPGTTYDGAFTIGTVAGGLGFTNGMLLHDRGGGPALNSAGAIIKVQHASPLSLARGFDFRAATFTGPILETEDGVLIDDGSNFVLPNTHQILFENAAGNAFPGDITMNASNQLTITSSAGALVLSAAANGTGFFGNIVPLVTNTYQIGADSLRLSNLFSTSTNLSGFTDTAEIATPATPTAGFVRVYGKAGGGLYKMDDTGIEVELGNFDITAFGAVQDGVTDDTAAVQDALDTIGVAYVDANKGQNVLISQVALANAGDRVIGLGWPTFVQSTAGTTPFFIQNSFQKLSGFKINGAAATLGVPAIRIRTDLASYTTLEMSDLYLIDCGAGIMDMDDGVNRANFVTIKNITMEGHRGYGVATWDCWASYHLDKVVVDRVGETGADFNFPAFYINGSEGVFFRNCAHNGSAGTDIQALQDGVTFEGCNFVVISNFIPDHSGGVGLHFITCNNVKIDQVTAVNCNLQGLFATSCTLFTMNQVHVTQLAGSGATVDGFRFTSCTTVRGSGLLATGFTRDGLRGDTCSRLRIEGEFSNNVGRGVTTINSGTVNLFHGCGTFGNTAGNYDIDGTTDFIRDTILQSGAIVDVAGPASG